MFNEKVACNFEAAAVISRRTPLGEGTHVGFDCANYLQELADRVRKADHELSATELAELVGSYKAMLVFEPRELPDQPCVGCRQRAQEPSFLYCVPCLKDQEQMRQP